MAMKTRIINLRRLGRLEEANRDLARAKKLVETYPHLAAQATHIEARDEK